MSVMRQLFGSSREEIWRQIASEMGADYVDGEFWNSDKVVARHREWEITLDTYFCAASKLTYTRLRTAYVDPDGFRFNVYRTGLFTELGKMMGMQDVEVGHEGFDEEFVIQGNDEEKLLRVFENERIRQLLKAQKTVYFAVKDKVDGWKDFSGDTDFLQFMVVGVIKDRARLRELFDLFAETLDELCRMGSAYEKAPVRVR